MAENNAANKVKDFKSKVRHREGELSDYVFGKVQPQALPLEEAVLGALMLDKDALSIVLDILRPESFYLEAHQLIYKAVLRLFEKSHPVDLLTVTEELKKSGDLEAAGGGFYLVELTNRVASSANIEYHARIVAQKHIQRELIKVSTQIIRDSYEDTTDVFTLLDDAEKGLFNITQNNLSRQYASMGELASKTLKILEELKNKKDGLTGVPTGFTSLDRLTSGWQPSDLIIIAARPGMGKTSYVLSLARNAALDFNKGVAFFSLEMSSTQLVQRLISMEAEIPGSKLRTGKLEEYEWQQLNSTIERLSGAPIYIDDTPGINIFELRAKCRRMKMQHDIQLIIIDYLQLMSGGTENSRNSGNREQEISSISRSLKGLAKELNVPVIALSQLSRAVEVRGGSKRPQLSDLRECLTGDTRIALADGCLRPIRELRGTGARVLAVNAPAQKLEAETTDLVWLKGKLPVFELSLASGRKIKTTGGHRLLSHSGWKTTQQLCPGDYLALANYLPEPEQPVFVSDERLALLALLIGGSSYSEGQPPRHTIASATTPANDAIGISAHQHANESQQPADLEQWLQELGIFDHPSREKQLPGLVFQLGNRQLAYFLQHLWATEGTIFTPQPGDDVPAHIAFPTNSRLLAEDIAHLLLRFGIVARIATHKPHEQGTGFRVEISGSQFQSRFLEVIGAIGNQRKEASRLEKYLQMSGVNTAPSGVVGDEKRYAGAKYASLRQIAETPATTLGNILHFHLPAAGVPKCYCNPQLDSCLSASRKEGDLSWDKLIEVTPAGEEEVYDLTVPEHQAFLANGIVSHNSGAIEQDADIVTFIYRPEYYQIMEDETGQSLKGIAEIIIAKHRNGALDTVKLRFMDQFTKFGDLEDLNFDSFPTADSFAAPYEASNIITRPSKMNDDEDIPF